MDTTESLMANPDAAGRSHLTSKQKGVPQSKAAMPRRTPKRFARPNDVEYPRGALWSAPR
jgi:hypothetical protein